MNMMISYQELVRTFLNKIRGKKDFMYICTLCCFAEEVKGDYSHYRTFLFDIGNQYKVKRKRAVRTVLTK